MMIEKDKVVSLTYELRVNKVDGELIESLNESAPLTFLYGSGRLLPKFESNIEGLKSGDSFTFDLACEDAYGPLNENAVVNVPKAAFEINGVVDHDLLQIGNTIPMQDSSGNRLNGIVKEVNGDKVKMDFNHPLAGNHLFFNGMITEIREASEEELTHGHIHNSGSCGCCSDCGDGSGNCC